MNTETEIKQVIEHYLIDWDLNGYSTKETIDRLYNLFPQWQTFSNDCKPEEGSRVLFKPKDNPWYDAIFYENELADFIAFGWQWYPIP